MAAPPLPLGRFYPDAQSPQTPSDIAVVMPSLLRADLADAVESVYAQDFEGRIQIAIGVDVAQGDLSSFDALFDRRPPNVSVLILTLPYSTSVRHGGLYPAMDGGALRTLLGYAANARHLAFLDDDNTWLPEHLRVLRRVIEGRVWAGSLRYLVDQDTGERLAVDRWDSLGRDRGRFKAQGGFVDPNCLMVDKLRIGTALGVWAGVWGSDNTLLSDRKFFQTVSKGSHAMVRKPTVIYNLRKNNVMHKFIKENPTF
jgi:hypothetical protein